MHDPYQRFAQGVFAAKAGKRRPGATAARPNQEKALFALAFSLSCYRYAKSRSKRPGRRDRSRSPSCTMRTPFTQTPCTPTASVVSRQWPPGRSKTRRFGPRFTLAGSKSRRSAWYPAFSTPRPLMPNTAADRLLVGVEEQRREHRVETLLEGQVEHEVERVLARLSRQLGDRALLELLARRLDHAHLAPLAVEQAEVRRSGELGAYRLPEFLILKNFSERRALFPQRRLPGLQSLERVRRVQREVHR